MLSVVVWGPISQYSRESHLMKPLPTAYQHTGVIKYSCLHFQVGQHHMWLMPSKALWAHITGCYTTWSNYEYKYEWIMYHRLLWLWEVTHQQQRNQYVANLSYSLKHFSIGCNVLRMLHDMVAVTLSYIFINKSAWLLTVWCLHDMMISHLSVVE